MTWQNVDGSGNTRGLIDYLDDARQLPGVARSKEWSIDQLQLHAGQRVLDVGCGTGEDVVALAVLVGPDGEAVGFDLSESMIAEAAKRHRHVPSASFRVGDSHRLPFQAESFDGCRVERTLQHLFEPGRTISGTIPTHGSDGNCEVSCPPTASRDRAERIDHHPDQP